MTPKSTPKPVVSNVAPLPVAKAAQAVRPAEAPVVTAKAPLKKKDFVDLAIARSGVKKADARLAIDATLATLAEALISGQEVVLPPLGKIKTIKEKTSKGGRQFVLRLVPPRTGDADTEGVAEAED